MGGGCLTSFVMGEQAQPQRRVVFEEIDDTAQGIQAAGEQAHRVHLAHRSHCDRHLWHRDERIVDALVRLAHALELSVTAEAVETEVQAERLRALRCDTGQGRLFGAPMPADGIRARLGG